jgi:hypothetical protein
MTIPSVDDLNADQAQFLAELIKDDALGVVIRSAIYIEFQLNKLIEESVESAEPIKRMNLMFFQQIDLAVALGLDERFVPPLRSLATIRNHFAHRPDAALGSNEVNGIYKTLSPVDKEAVQAAYRNTRKRLPSSPTFQDWRDLDALDKFRLIAMSLRAALVVGRRQVASVQGQPDSTE